MRPVAPLVLSELLLLATHRLTISRCMVVLVVAASPWMVLLVLVGVNFGSTPIACITVALIAILVTSAASTTVFTLVDGSGMGVIVVLVIAGGGGNYRVRVALARVGHVLVAPVHVWRRSVSITIDAVIKPVVVILRCSPADVVVIVALIARIVILNGATSSTPTSVRAVPLQAALPALLLRYLLNLANGDHLEHRRLILILIKHLQVGFRSSCRCRLSCKTWLDMRGALV